MSTSGGAVVVAMARRAERTIVQTLREHGATSADRAVPLSVGRPGGRAALRRLTRCDAVRPNGERYWLDERAWEAMRDGRRVRAVFALIVVAAVVIGLVAFGATRAGAQTPALRPDQAAFRALYEELVETNTTLSQGSCTLASERMAARLLAAGYPAADVRILTPADRPRDGNLAAVLRGSDRSAEPLLLLAHIDVVEANPADWTRDPFTLVEEDGYFYARGASDDKAQASVWVDTLVRLKSAGFRPRRDIKLALTCGEETADTWNGVEWLLREHPDALQAGFALNEGAGGQLDAEGNRVALNVQAGEKLYQDYTLELTNPGGHSARPRKDNAIAAMSRSLAALGDYDFALELNPVTRAYFAAVAETSPQYAADLRALTANDTPDAAAAARLSAANPIWNATMRTTCIPTLINGGHAPNAQPQRVTANVNCRIFPGHTIEETQAEIARVLNNPAIAISPLGAADPTSPPPTLSPAILDPIRQIAGRMWPGVPVVPTMAVGATDGRFTNKAGIPTYGVTGMFGDPDGGGAHGLNERIRVRSLYEGRDFLFDLVKAYASAP
ncbi:MULTISPECIES: M20/M25/M40 family metallo-hydrolase [unclassified Brevundimonas]|uniref:M20/M25/M40 family metallo-hydrolase n=1 Tax=unclassified Brevundimonas TaxID=2622653 RepID=UPI000A69C66D|nr:MULTISPECIES: M20/M25/M40 family metallo-hydrolase [unclassified Brevundimonas]